MERYAGNIIRKYGSDITITEKENVIYTKGIIRPLYYRDRTRAVFSRISAGLFDNRHYLVMLPANVKLERTGGEQLMCNGITYSVNTNGSYIVKNKIIYVWAVLSACTDPVEDDYDRNN